MRLGCWADGCAQCTLPLCSVASKIPANGLLRLLAKSSGPLSPTSNSQSVDGGAGGMHKVEPGFFSGVPFHTDDFFPPVLSHIQTIILVFRPNQGLGGSVHINHFGPFAELEARFLVIRVAVKSP